MRAGDLDTIISIRSRDAGQATDGQPVLTFTQIAEGECWAKFIVQKGAETLEAGKDTSVLQCVWRVRYRTDVAADMRVYEGAAAYEVKAVLPDKGGRQYVDLLCEFVSGG